MLLQVKGLIKIIVKFRPGKVLCTFVSCIKVVFLKMKGWIKIIVKLRAEKILYKRLYTYRKQKFQNILERKLSSCFGQLLHIYYKKFSTWN